MHLPPKDPFRRTRFARTSLSPQCVLVLPTLLAAVTFIDRNRRLHRRHRRYRMPLTANGVPNSKITSVYCYAYRIAPAAPIFYSLLPSIDAPSLTPQPPSESSFVFARSSPITDLSQQLSLHIASVCH